MECLVHLIDKDDRYNRYEIVKDDGTPETGNPKIFEYIEDWSD